MISLESCSQLLEDAPNCLALLEAWQRWRGNGLVPSVDRVIPEELGTALNGLSILEVHSQDSITYRLVGTIHADAMGREPTGEDVASITDKADLSRRMGRLWNMVSVPCGSAMLVVYTRPSGATLQSQHFLLPVMPKASGEPKRLYVAMDTFGAAALPNDQHVGPVSIPREFSYVDIGNGAPE